nr:integrase, catalytic region, zinc finger, CCHC-type, peptidase aspartic, catalytic [Tanacetum cinerariifolium]
KDTLSSNASAPTFAELFEINDLKAHAQAKDTVILNLKEKLNFPNGDVKDRDVDVTPVVQKLHKNRTAHIDYIRHTQGEANTLRKIVESERLLSPLNTSLDMPVVQIVPWYLDSGCSKHMTEDRSQLINFVQKFLGTVKFGNDHVAKIMGYGDYQIGNVTISRVYYMEGLGYNLFSVGRFCDSNLKVAFRQHTCFIRNLEGVDLLT